MTNAQRMTVVMDVLFENTKHTVSDLTALQIAWTIDENVKVEQDLICEDNTVYVFSDWSRYTY